MKKLLVAVALFSIPLHAQTALTTVKSTPIFQHGVQLPLVKDPAHNVNVISRMMDPIRKRYLPVFVGVHNTGSSSNLDFDPSGIRLTAVDGTSIRPMSASEVKDMAIGTLRRQTLGAVGVSALLNVSNSMSNRNRPLMEVYQQSRIDDMSDAAFANIGQNYLSMQNNNLLHSTVFPGEKLLGFVYFDLGKNQAVSGSVAAYSLRLQVFNQMYQLDYSQTPHFPDSQTARVENVAATIPNPVPLSAPVPLPLPTPVAKDSLLSITSLRDGADIELDGKFVGNTPTQIEVPPGDHTLVITKDGCLPWEKKLHVMAGAVTINAQLKSQQPSVYRVR